MEAVILAGGRGTRLKPYTTTLPKPLVPVGEHPILSIILTQLRGAGFRKVTLAVNHMAELIMSFFRSGEQFDLELAYSIETTALGTVGPLTLIPDLPEHFLVMNGDILTDIDYNSLFEAHLKSDVELTIATYERDLLVDFGVLDIANNSGRITGFSEKPTYHFNVSMGVYVFARRLLERIPQNTPYGLDDLVLDMLRTHAPINAYSYRGYWLDLGRPDDYDRANEDIVSQSAFANLIIQKSMTAPGKTKVVNGESVLQSDR
jgi:NDP-sugar pyrophosphorylase family protein